MRCFQFLGLAISGGQDHIGASYAADSIREYFSILKKIGFECLDNGDIHQVTEPSSKIMSELEIQKFDWSCYKHAFRKIQKLYSKEGPVLNWGGDHSVGISTVSAFLSQFPDGYVMWVDAHADINLPDHSLTGNLHGMPLAILMNLDGIAQKYFKWIPHYLRPSRLIYVGLRDVDPFEKRVLHSLGMQVITADDFNTNDISQLAAVVKKQIGASPLHVSFDIDSLSPEYAPSTGLPVSNGLSPKQLCEFGRALSLADTICSMDVVEINPMVGSDSDVLKTNVAAIEFARALFFRAGRQTRGNENDTNRGSDQKRNTASLESNPSVSA